MSINKDKTEKNTVNKYEMAERGFSVHMCNLIKEIADCAIPRNMGVLKRPLQIFMRYLESIAIRASELNDPILNKLMCDMALYESCNPASKDYDPKIKELIYNQAKEYRLNKGEN